MPRSRRPAVQKYHDRVAPRYDDMYGDPFWRWHDMLTWDYLKPYLPRDVNAEIVDLGCGTGKWAARLLKSGFAVTGVDVSHRMLEQARMKVEAMGGVAKARFIRADLNDLSALPAERFALAVALGEPIGCSPAPIRVMKEIRRILRPEATLIATFDNRLAGIDYYLQRGDASALARYLRDGKTHWLTDDVEERFPIIAVMPGEIAKLAAASGFKVVEMIGKTVLPMRHYRRLLENPQTRPLWQRIEKRLCRDPYAIGRAAHIQVAFRGG